MSDLNPDGSTPNICQVCGVDHDWGMGDLSSGNIQLMLHAQERMEWMEFPANGDMIARQRAGILSNSLLGSITDPQEMDWDAVARRRKASA